MGWLMLGPMDAVGTGEGLCAGLRTQRTQTHTRFTQVQGPREEVNPYSCLSEYMELCKRPTLVLLELYV